MQINKTKKGFILKDCGLSIPFTSYEYSSINDVYLYQNGVLVAIYENVEKFEEQLKSC
jgi:sulfur transfer complex TusBCD TusB component (DsrH family)